MKKKWSMIILALTVVLSAALRFADWSADGYKNLNIAFILTAAIGTLLFAVTVFAGKTDSRYGMVSAYDADCELTQKRSSIILASFSAMTFMFILWDLISNTDMLNMGALRYLLIGFELGSCVIFGITAINQYINKTFTKSLGYGYLIPTLWATLRAAQLFKNSSIIVNNKQDLLKLLYLLSQIVFFVFFARYRAGFAKRFTKQTILISGAVMSVLTLSAIIPSFVYIGVSETIDGPLVLCDLCISLFAVCTMARFFGKDYETVKENIESETEFSADVNAIESDVEND